MEISDKAHEKIRRKLWIKTYAKYRRKHGDGSAQIYADDVLLAYDKKFPNNPMRNLPF